MSTPHPLAPALSPLVVDVEQQVAREGWEQPARLFALVETSDLVRRDPALAEELGLAGSDAPPLTPVEQDDLPPGVELEDLLGQIAWPAEVAGTMVAVERLVLPPEAEAELPADPEQVAAWAASHPARRDVRLVAGVLRDGSRYCAVRVRPDADNPGDSDPEGDLLTGDDLAPALTDALAATLTVPIDEPLDEPVDGANPDRA